MRGQHHRPGLFRRRDRNPAAQATARARALEVTVAAAVLIVLGASVYDPGLGLLLLVMAAVGYLLHLLVVYLADAGLLWPSVALVGCLGIGLWVYLPDDFDTPGKLLARAPAPVGRLLAPVVRRIAAGSNPTPAAVPSADLARTETAAGRAAATTQASSLVRTRMPAAPGATVAIVLTQSSPASPAGGVVLFTVSVRRLKDGPGVPPGRVDLVDGKSRIVRSAALVVGKSASRAIFKLSSLTVGNHVLTAQYRGAAGFAPATSGTIVHTVSPAR